jgi:hypothetical protein
MDCKHDISQLIGTAEGIKCKACGQLFKAIPTQKIKAPVAEPVPVKTEEPEKAPAKKPTTTKKGAKK